MVGHHGQQLPALCWGAEAMARLEEHRPHVRSQQCPTMGGGNMDMQSAGVAAATAPAQVCPAALLQSQHPQCSPDPVAGLATLADEQALTRGSLYAYDGKQACEHSCILATRSQTSPSVPGTPRRYQRCHPMRVP